MDVEPKLEVERYLYSICVEINHAMHLIRSRLALVKYDILEIFDESPRQKRGKQEDS